MLKSKSGGNRGFTIKGLKFSTTLLFLACLSLSIYAQDTPKIGLVLSGGGAKGMAHIGILKALEEAGITPDYITGTSMGSIMGALYSIGYSADEIKEIALTANWDQLLSNKLKLDEVVYEEKEYYGRFIYDFNIKGFKLQLPKGLIDGQKLSMTLSTLTRNVMNIEDFSKFPIPFACIGTDIVSGEKIVLNKGSLALAMRASMAIPSVFTPVTIDNHLLVDGGLVHNFPVDENIAMGADYIIGVYVGTDLLKKEEISSPVSVLTQSASIIGSMDNAIQKKMVNLYIEPDLQGNATADFHKAAEIIAIGEKYGQMYVEKFKALNDSLKKLGRVNKKITKPPLTDSVFISEIRVVNNNFVPSGFIIDRLGIAENTRISINYLEKGITNLFGTGIFTKILYELKDSGNETILIIDISEATEGKIRAGLQYDRETGVALLLNLTYRNLLFNNSRMILEGEISENPILDVNYLKYFGERHKLGFNAGYYLRNAEVPEIENQSITGLLEYNYNRYFAALQSLHKTNRLIQLSYAYETATINPKIVAAELQVIDKIVFNAHSLEFKYDYNSLDDRYYPKKGNNWGVTSKFTNKAGIRLDLFSHDSVPASSSKIKNNGSFLNKFYLKSVWPLSNRISIGMQNSFTLNLIKSDSLNVGTGFLNKNYIGGFRKLAPNVRPFWGAEPLRYFSDNLFFNELMFQYEFKRNMYFQLISQYYYANPLSSVFPGIKEGNYSFEGKRSILGAGATVAYNTPFGPVSFSAGKGNTSARWQYFINLGFYFDRN